MRLFLLLGWLLAGCKTAPELTAEPAPPPRVAPMPAALLAAWAASGAACPD